VRATISVGIATYPDHGRTPEELIRRADLALYRAKTQGRNRIASADTAADDDGTTGQAKILLADRLDTESCK